MRPCSGHVSLFKLQPLSSDHGETALETGLSPQVALTLPVNLSPARTLAFEPLGHLPISIPEMANQRECWAFLR